MAQQTSVSLIDDIDGGKANETVTFSLDGSSFEIDLSKKNAAALRKAMTEFVENGRRVKATSTSAARRRHRRGSKSTPALIREWATGQGITMSSRGRIPAEVVARYELANA